MSFFNDVTNNRLTDPRRLFQYLGIDRISLSRSKSKSKKKRKDERDIEQTVVRRYDKEDSTVLNIRFGSENGKSIQKDKLELPSINPQTSRKSKKVRTDEINQIFDIPHPQIRYKRENNASQCLKNMGYSSDLRLAFQIYADKVEQKKQRYLNRMQIMKRNLHEKEHLLENKSLRDKMKVKILGQEIRRKREYDILKRQQRQGRRMLKSVLLSSYLSKN